jgi:hypothetical protein
MDFNDGCSWQNAKLNFTFGGLMAPQTCDTESALGLRNLRFPGAVAVNPPSIDDNAGPELDVSCRPAKRTSLESRVTIDSSVVGRVKKCDSVGLTPAGSTAHDGAAPQSTTTAKLTTFSIILGTRKIHHQRRVSTLQCEIPRTNDGSAIMGQQDNIARGI